MAIADIIVKTILLLTSAFPSLGLDWKRRILLHYMTTSMALGLAVFDQYKTVEVDYLSQLDPLCGLFGSFVLTIIVVPTSKKLGLKIHITINFSMRTTFLFPGKQAGVIPGR